MRIYTPYAAAGEPAVTIERTVAGECQGSAHLLRREAWRCFTQEQGTNLYNPCFGTPGDQPATLLCLSSPFEKSPIEVRAADGLDPALASKPVEGEATDGLPWAVELVDGRRCTIIGGATTTVAGKRMNYGCTDRSPLDGEPDRNQSTWAIFSTEEDSQTLHQVDVMRAYF